MSVTSANPANDASYIHTLIAAMAADLTKAAAIHELFRRGDLSFLLHDGQRTIADTVRRTKSGEVLVLCSRQLGKSFAALCIALEHCVTHPRSLVKIYAPTAEQAQNIVADNLAIIQLLAPPGFITQAKTDRRWKIQGGSELRVHTLAGAHIDKARGGNAGLIITDEGGFVSSEEFAAAVGGVIGPQLLRSQGKLIHISTPSRDPAHHLHTKVLPKCDKAGALVRLTIYDNPQLSPEQIDAAKALGTEEDWCREYLAEIKRSETTSVVPEFDVATHVAPQPPVPPPHATWLTSLDFGGTVDSHGLLLCYWDHANDQFVVWDERFLPINTLTKDIVTAAKEMEQQAQWVGGFPNRVSDCTGQIVTDLGGMGYPVRTPKKPPGSKQAGIHAIRVAMRNNRIVIHPRCRHLIGTLVHAQFTKNREDVRRNAYGHGDLLWALIYGWRHMSQANPTPATHGMHLTTHHIPPDMQSIKHPLSRLFTT